MDKQIAEIIDYLPKYSVDLRSAIVSGNFKNPIFLVYHNSASVAIENKYKEYIVYSSNLEELNEIITQILKHKIHYRIIIFGSSDRGLSDVTITVSASLSAIWPINGLLNLSRSPPQPNTTQTFDLDKFFITCKAFCNASGVCE